MEKGTLDQCQCECQLRILGQSSSVGPMVPPTFWWLTDAAIIMRMQGSEQPAWSFDAHGPLASAQLWPTTETTPALGSCYIYLLLMIVHVLIRSGYEYCQIVMFGLVFLMDQKTDLPGFFCIIFSTLEYTA